MCRDIKILIEKNPSLKSDFIVSKYISSRNRKYYMFLVTINGESILNSKYKYNVCSARFETKFGNELYDFCKSLNYKLEMQYNVKNKYRIDFYLPDFSIAIEYDESEHRFQLQKDLDRQKEIELVVGCKFIRVSEKESIGEALAKITASILQRQVMPLHT